jgi:NADH:ubiquinone oxidoreductase subunit 6 (subunit J)
MVMFMMNPAGLMPMSMVHNKRGSLAISIGVFLALSLGAILIPWPQRRGHATGDVTRALGQTIMGPKMLVMIGVSTVLFATMVSALTLASARGRYDRPRQGRADPSTADTVGATTEDDAGRSTGRAG